MTRSVGGAVLNESLARLTLMLREVAQSIDYARQGCPVSHALALDLKDLADELDDFSLAVDVAEQESTRH